ncbi:tyrosine-type recombinase/integrase [Bordetella hinzii]|uniref:tyrosine-type recombinase/integrase n=1 Tax=Bordetella hinzii TaxID=103855 RepID=UPI00051956FF|nr:site-specific integrase [Bordetella hinzii]QDJ35873.1 integrase [Bordetella hinzii]
MSIYFDKSRRRYRFEFDRLIGGRRVRATKLLPKAWNQAQADKFDREESGRLYAIAQGIEKVIPLIDTAVRHYLDTKKELKSYMHAARHLAAAADYYKNKRLNELADVSRSIQEKEAGNWKPATMKQRIALIRAACRSLWKDRRLDIPDPASHVSLPEVNNERRNYVTRPWMLRMCRKINNRPARALLLIAFYSGMRRGEIWSAQVHGDHFVLADTKNGEPRNIPVMGKVAHYARKHLPPKISYRSLMIWLKKGAAAIGRPELTLHDLRHSTASNMVQAGVPLYTVGRVLGHKSTASTARYAHLATDSLQVALQQISAPKKPRKGVGKI